MSPTANDPNSASIAVLTHLDGGSHGVVDYGRTKNTILVVKAVPNQHSLGHHVEFKDIVSAGIAEPTIDPHCWSDLEEGILVVECRIGT